jgi:hypothetical protein
MAGNRYDASMEAKAIRLVRERAGDNPMEWAAVTALYAIGKALDRPARGGRCPIIRIHHQATSAQQMRGQMASELTDFEHISVAELCAAEVTARGLPQDAGDRVRDAFCGNNVSGEDRLAAKQAIAAALRRRVSSGAWPSDKDRQVMCLAQAFAVAYALDDEKRPGVVSPAADLDRRKALRDLQRRMDRDSVLRERVAEEFCQKTGMAADLPRTFRMRGVPVSVENLASMLIAGVGGALGKRPQATYVVDPDPWGTVGSTADVPGKKPDDNARDGLLASLLGVYSAQYASYTSLLWQVPALSLTAQAFLLTIALTGGNDNRAKVLASSLSIVIAFASTRLMHDQRGHAINHGELAFRVSRELRLAQQLGDLNVEDAKPPRTNAETVWIGWDHGIYAVWKTALYLFFLADVIVLIFVIVKAA